MYLLLRGLCRTRLSDRRRLSADDVLTRIDAPVDWRWCSPPRKRGLRRSGIGPQGYDPPVRFKCPLIGQ
ncbi:MAG: hypothetical protein GDA36_08375 [Rhodobacteraceae bacterium]|nr:hypothetical protein [Paracoccaceae bacterium]